LTDLIDLREEVRDILSKLSESRTPAQFYKFVRDTDQHLEDIGVLVGDSQHLDPEYYEGNPEAACRWLLGQFRDFAQELKDGLGPLTLGLFTAWEMFAERILQEDANNR
jgi:hypothetical protein